ncbi:MAG: succinyl-diaminopimelate desuccinylase [Hyphomicrobiales bacterium]
MADAVTLTRDLIRCPSVTPAEGGALDYLEATLKGAGFTCWRLPFGEVDNLFARRGKGSPHVCFAGHTDVVPPGDDEAWDLPPFGGEEKDGELYGRGAVDMKGGVACFVAAALDHAAQTEAAPRGSVSLLITGDEEGPAVDGTIKVLAWMAANGHVPDHCLVGEPTNPDRLGQAIKIGRRGSLNAALKVGGVQGHSAYPHRADNPIPKIARMLDRLSSEPLDAGSEHFEPSTLAITSVDVGNPATNVIPASASAQFNIRYNDRHSVDSLKRWIAERCDAVAAELGGDYALDLSHTGDCFLTEPGPLVDVLAHAIEAETGQPPELATNGGTSDARFIKDFCPVVEFGLVGQTMHQVNERVPLGDLDVLTRIYRRFLDRYFATMAT